MENVKSYKKSSATKSFTQAVNEKSRQGFKCLHPKKDWQGAQRHVSFMQQKKDQGSFSFYYQTPENSEMARRQRGGCLFDVQLH